jgi:catechol 2,3-dioxygenase-like lactoylglutathione lyase family enzyme
MKVSLTSVFVNDQDAALAFYTEKLGFEVKHNLPMGEHSWLTVVSPEDPEGTELLLEPAVHPAVKPYRDALVADGIALAQFEVESVEAEAERLIEKGVRFVQPPTQAGPVTIAVFDDTCGNLIMIQSSS